MALEVCTTTLAGTNTGQHYRNRPTSKKRQKLTKQLNAIKCLKSHLNSVTSSAMSFEELEEQYPENHSLNCAAHDLNNFMPEHIRQGTLHKQIRNAEYHIISELARTDKTHAKECHQRERKKQQKTINKEPKKAHQQIFASSNQKRSGLSALKDPRTGHITSDPQMVKDIIYDFYKQSLSAVKPKTGKYLPNEAPRHYPWEQTQAPDPFELESHITRDEKKGTRERLATPLNHRPGCIPRMHTIIEQ